MGACVGAGVAGIAEIDAGFRTTPGMAAATACEKLGFERAVIT